MKRRMNALFVACAVSVFAVSSLWAQGTAQISGTARDQSGAVLPGVEVTATQTETGIGRMTVTNETGAFALPNLPVGPYRMEATLPGFRTYIRQASFCRLMRVLSLIRFWRLVRLPSKSKYKQTLLWSKREIQVCGHSD